MSSIVIYTSGTLGDHLPYLALGQALQRRGHQVRLIINRALHSYAERAGLEAFAFTDIDRGPEHTRQNAWAWNHWNLEAAPVDLPSLPDMFQLYLTQIRQMAEYCRSADLLIGTSIRNHSLALHLATGIPWLTASLNAVSFSAPPTKEQQESKHAARLIEYQVYQPIIDYTLEQMGSTKTVGAWRPGWSYGRHIVLASSPHFSQVALNQLQPHSSIDPTGFWFYDDPLWDTWQPDADLAAFCERRPLALAFSSQPVEDPRRVLELHVAAANRLGLPLLVQRGWAGFDANDLPESAIPGQVLFADYLPHSWLFKRAAATIQHGGIGSIAQALLAGCPLLIEPYGNDQFYNANQVLALKVGATAHPFEMTVDSLTHTLETQVLSDATRRRAAEVGAKLRAEQGVEDACSMIERYLSRLTPGGGHSALYDKFTPPLTPRVRQPAQAQRVERAFRILLSENGQPAGEQIVPEQQALARLQDPDALPLISCLMITNQRPALAQHAVECFQRQTYPHKELIIVDEGWTDDFEAWVTGLQDARIVYQRVRGAKRALGELRNLSVSLATGAYIATWDDDDLYHPQRLLYQWTALQAWQATACCLERIMVWWPDSQRLAISNPRRWENTLLARKDGLPAFPAWQSGSDAPVVQQLVSSGRMARLDYPQMYLHIYHGGNLRSAAHWEGFWSAASARLSGEAYPPALASLQADLQLDLPAYAALLQALPPAPAADDTASSAASAANLPVADAPIPHILHQTWKDALLPDDLRTWQHTWIEQHPTWTYRLWTDYELRALIEQDYAWFLPIFDGYAEPIKRADAGRYFIMHRYGGVYADLDFECLRPLEPLLEGKVLLFGLEPSSHLQQALAQSSGLTQLVGNAFIASQPGLPFWEHVFRQLVACHKLPSPLDATGPFFLTRALHSASPAAPVTLAASPLLYPVDKDTSWQGLDEAERSRLAHSAYGVHHWRGTWWRSEIAAEARLRRVQLFQNSTRLSTLGLDMQESLRLQSLQTDFPKISCLMVTRGRLALAQRSVACFQRQTYPNLELLIIDDDPDPALGLWLAQLGDARIRHLHLPDEHLALGDLRNLAVEQAQGEYLAQWDDDDLSDPQRLEQQMAVIQALQVDVCLLERHQVWWPGQQRLAHSARRMWESSYLCARSHQPAYPPLRKGEDTLVTRMMVRGGRAAVLDAPELYVYVCHGSNTFESAHWDEQWRLASATFEGAHYQARLEQLQARLQLDLAVE